MMDIDYARTVVARTVPADELEERTAQALELSRSFRQDCIDWEIDEHADLAQLVVDLGELLDTLGDIVDRCDPDNLVSTSREEYIHSSASESGEERGAQQVTEALTSGYRTAISEYFEDLGRDAEYTGKPVVIADRWDALNLAGRAQSDIADGARVYS